MKFEESSWTVSSPDCKFVIRIYNSLSIDFFYDKVDDTIKISAPRHEVKFLTYYQNNDQEDQISCVVSWGRGNAFLLIIVSKISCSTNKKIWGNRFIANVSIILFSRFKNVNIRKGFILSVVLGFQV